ncbi:MAG: hypothetical protein MI810_03190 [Flavobacteriales bacterium]|nr:hypothetical protein [Flavobacteriales bacterium]
MLRSTSFFIFILFLTWSYKATTQVDSVTTKVLPGAFDSIQFSIWNVQFKEASLDGKEYMIELDRKLLVDGDDLSIANALINEPSYDYTRSMQNHFNLVFDFYLEGKIAAKVTISTMTGNVDISNKINKNYFRNNCSEKLNHLLIQLLEKYNFLHHLDEIDLMGIK